MKYLKLFTDNAESLRLLQGEEFKEFVLALLSYAETGETPSFAGDARFLWPAFMQQIDRQRDTYERKVEIAKSASEAATRKNAAVEELKSSDNEWVQAVYRAAKSNHGARQPNNGAGKSNNGPLMEQDKDKDQDKDIDKDKDQDQAKTGGADGLGGRAEGGREPAPRTEESDPAAMERGAKLIAYAKELERRAKIRKMQGS